MLNTLCILLLWDPNSIGYAAQIINTELPDTLDSVERASLEFEELGQSLNGLTGGLKRSRPLATRQRGKKAAVEAGEAAAAVKDAGRGQDRGPVGAIQASTANSMRKVAQDISALTAVSIHATSTFSVGMPKFTELMSGEGSLLCLGAGADTGYGSVAKTNQFHH